MSFTILIIFSLVLFLAVAASNRNGHVTIAFTKGWLFGFVYDAEVEDGVKYHTFQSAVGFIILNVDYETEVNGN